MPELPEVETIRRDLTKKLVGLKITDIRIELPRVVKNKMPDFKKNLVGNRIAGIGRIGKLLIFHPEKGERKLLVHLKMTGQLIYEKGGQVIAGGHSDQKKELCLPCRHTRVIFHFADGARLYFNDLRTFGYLKLADEAEIARIRAGYGPEPLGKEFTPEVFRQALKRRKTSVKAVLLDQAVVAGLGNIYVDEILFRARLRPGRSAASLKKAEIERIFRAIKPVLNAAIRYRGTTFNNYRDADGKRGDFVKRLMVYGQADEKCKQCGGLVIKTKVAGRGTHYCPRCQK